MMCRKPSRGSLWSWGQPSLQDSPPAPSPPSTIWGSSTQGNIIPNPIFQQSYDHPQSHLQQSDDNFNTGNITPNPTFRLCPLSRPPARVNPHGWPGRRVRIKSNISFGILPYSSALPFSSPFLTSSWWAMSPPGLRPWSSGTVRRLRDNSPTTVGPGEQINTTPLLWIVPPVPFRASVWACSHRLSNLH